MGSLAQSFRRRETEGVKGSDPLVPGTEMISVRELLKNRCVGNVNDPGSRFDAFLGCLSSSCRSGAMIYAVGCPRYVLMPVATPKGSSQIRLSLIDADVTLFTFSRCLSLVSSR